MGSQATSVHVLNTRHSSVVLFEHFGLSEIELDQCRQISRGYMPDFGEYVSSAVSS